MILIRVDCDGPYDPKFREQASLFVLDMIAFNWPGCNQQSTSRPRGLNTHNAVLMIIPTAHLFLGCRGYLSFLYLTQPSLIA